MGNLIIFLKVMLVSSITSVLVSPTSLNTPGILFLLVLPGGEELLSGWTPSDCSGGGGVYCRESALLSFCHTECHFPRGTHHSKPKYLQAHILKSTSQPSFVPCRGRCEAFLAQSRLAQQDERRREEVKGKVRQTQG